MRRHAHRHVPVVPTQRVALNGLAVQRWLTPPILALGAAVLVAGTLVATLFPAGGNDDSHITYWSAHALSEYGGVLSYNGHRVEQSSSLTLVVLLALFRKLTGVALPTLGWVLGLASGALAIGLASFLPRKEATPARIWCPLLLGTWLPFLYWSSSGMEMTLVVLLGGAVAMLAGSVIDDAPTRARWGGLSGAVAAFALVRPEAPLELVAAGATCATAAAFVAFRERSPERREQRNRALLVLAVMVGTVVLIGAVRWWLFGLVVPNSASAKVGAMNRAIGASYLVEGMKLANPVLPAVAFAGAVVVLRDVLARRCSHRALFFLALALASAAFVVGSGGDWMPGARLVAPLGLPLSFLAVAGMEPLQAKIGRFVHVLGAALVALNLHYCVEFSRSRANNSYASRDLSTDGLLDAATADQFSFSELANKSHRRDAKLLEVLLPLVRRAEPTPDDPLVIMSGQAGMVPFHLFTELYGRARFIDLYGLTTPEVVPCIPESSRTHLVQGIRLSSGYIIDHADDLDPGCGVQRPGIVFSTGRFPDYLRERGYRKVYQGKQDLDAFVAVDRKLLDAIRDRDR
jgi:hypothetical protein